MKRHPPRRPGPHVPTVRPAAEAGWRRLHDRATDELFPCVVDPSLHFDDERISEAVEACQPCPLIVACDEFATANKESYGVWGGRDRNKAHPVGRHTRQSEQRARAADPGDTETPGEPTAPTPGGGGVKISRPQPTADRPDNSVCPCLDYRIRVGGGRS